jgi:hypothetical protein
VTRPRTSKRNLFHYERLGQPLLDSRRFVSRMLRHIGVSATLAVVSLIIGMLGYVYFESLSWTDAFLNASMLLGGMGPVNMPMTEGGKLFAGMYALYSGVIFLVVAGIMGAPLVHRILHRFHLEENIKD